MKTISATLIISFYNNPQALELIFEALIEQWPDHFDVIIADDGSREEVTVWLSNRIKDLPFSVTHVWHEDSGFRKNRILNKAIRQAKNECLIFIDGDCIPQDRFIRDHLEAAEPGFVTCGRRVELSEKHTNLLMDASKKSRFSHQYFWRMGVDYVWQSMKGKSTKYSGKHIKNGLCLPWLKYLMGLSKKTRSIIGCNFSMYKSDLEKINGFDMNYEAPAVGEDTDIEYRLHGVGVRTKAIKFGAALLHMYHDELSRPSENKALFKKTVENKTYWAKNGLDRLK